MSYLTLLNNKNQLQVSHQNNEPSKLLIVDDNPTNLGILFEYLTNSGFLVLVALDGESAIEQVEYAKPDIILLDIMMPGIDGFATCERLKANPLTQDIPVIFMTALADTVDKVRGFKVGAVDYITKPIQQEEVLSRIQTHLTIRNLQKKLEQQNQHLQHEINERQQKAWELEQTVQQLQQTQAQLIQAEKMSSLGKMVAGVAHEINNPVTFIYGNLDWATEYIQQLLGLIELYEQTYPNPTPEIAAEIETIELDFLKSDLLQILKSMKVGTERLCQLVLLLRNFSRLDEAELKWVDIHEGIDTTLLLLQHRLKETAKRPAIQVIKEYGNLPKVWCFPGQLNQVFMNIVANAIDALEQEPEQKEHNETEQSGYCGATGLEKADALNVANADVCSDDSGVATTSRSCGDTLRQTPTTNCSASSSSQSPIPTIRICTEVIEDANETSPAYSTRIAIRIADNGPGMTEDVNRKLFDPFFTTKPVGSGTGLGLAISYQIVVKKHKGQLLATSEKGKGTEFAIEIPLVQPDYPT